MSIEFLVLKGTFDKAQQRTEADDLRKLHEIRGRLIHWLTIIERVMNEYCGRSGSNLRMFDSAKKKFIKKLRKNGFGSDPNFSSFCSALNKIHPIRNSWAHEIVFYEPRVGQNVNNSLDGKNGVQSVAPPYFVGVSDDFVKVITWLESKNLWKLNNYNISTRIRL